MLVENRQLHHSCLHQQAGRSPIHSPVEDGREPVVVGPRMTPVSESPSLSWSGKQGRGSHVKRPQDDPPLGVDMFAHKIFCHPDIVRPSFGTVVCKNDPDVGGPALAHSQSLEEAGADLACLILSCSRRVSLLSTVFEVN